MSCFESNYYEKMKPYQLIAFLCEKQSTDGLIMSCDFFNPMYENEPRAIEILAGHEDLAQLSAYIDELITRWDLNKVFCEKILKSKGLRYLVGVGFHDCPVILENNASDYRIVVDNEFGHHTPQLTGSRFQISYRNISYFEAYYKGDEPRENRSYFFDRYMIFVTESGELYTEITLNTHDEPYVTRQIKLVCSNIEIEKYE